MADYERTTTHAHEPGGSHPRESVVSTEREHVAAGPSGTLVARRVVTLIFGILQAFLVLRIILLLLIANPGNEVVALIRGFTDPFVEPFRGMFQLDRVTADSGSMLDVAALVALLAWTLVEALVVGVVSIGARRSETA